MEKTGQQIWKLECCAFACFALGLRLVRFAHSRTSGSGLLLSGLPSSSIKGYRGNVGGARSRSTSLASGSCRVAGDLQKELRRLVWMFSAL